MHQLLPLAVRKSLQKNVSSVLIELSNFFNDLCSKVGIVEEFALLTYRITSILCHLENVFPPLFNVFPPLFFDIMVHLPIHLADEAKIAGPIQYQWM